MSSLTSEQHEYLLTLVTNRLGEGAEVAPDRWSVSGAHGGAMGLYNLSLSLSDVPEDRWPEIVGEWVDCLATPPSLPETFDKARAHLRIRLSADASQPGWASYRPVCQGLDQMLVLRTEPGAVTVSDAQLATWDADPEEAWNAALEHTVWDEARERKILEKDGVLIAWVSGSFFASSLLLSMRHLLSPGNRFGAVVMVPVRDALLYAEVNDERIVGASAGMIELGGRWYVDEPGPISPDLFWYQPTNTGTTISRLVKVVDHSYQPCWGADFSAVLAEISTDLATIDSDRRRHRSPKRGPSTIPM